MLLWRGDECITNVRHGSPKANILASSISAGSAKGRLTAAILFDWVGLSTYVKFPLNSSYVHQDNLCTTY